MQITPHVLALRAVGAEFARRILLPILVIAASILIVALGLSIWLVTLSEWWWFLLAPIIFLTLLFTFSAVIGGLIIRMLEPSQTKKQRSEVKRFVDALQETSEAVQTPKVLLLIRVMKDVVIPGKESYIGKLSSSALSLKSRLKTIVTLFS